MDEITLPHTVKLSKPFKFGPETHTEVIFERELTGGDIAYAQNAGDKAGDFTLRLLEKSTALPEPLLKALPAKDYLALAAVAQSFLPSGPGTGN